MPRPTFVIRVAGVGLSRRALATFAAVAMAFGGMAFAYAVPVAMATDVRFVTPRDCVAGLLVGLVFAFLGNGALTAFTTPRRKVPPMVQPPDLHGDLPVQADIDGHGYLSSEPGERDDVSLIFTYRPHQPYSVLLDIALRDQRGNRMSRSTVWEVSREVLHEAVMLGRPSGLGDFSASAFSARRMQLRVRGADHLGRDAGYHYDMRLSRAKLRSFLLSTMDAVPLGRESSRLNMDYQLQMLLS